jgi:hypothetical protein
MSRFPDALAVSDSYLLILKGISEQVWNLLGSIRHLPMFAVSIATASQA